MNIKFLFFVSVVFFLPSCSPSGDSRNPFDAESLDFQQWGPRLADDAIMPDAETVQSVESWSKAAFTEKNASRDNVQSFSLELIRQDYSMLKFDESCMSTPLKLGSRSFAKGLGTHSNSEIRVTFPEPVTKFSAFAGIDNNDDTGGTRGSVQFAVVVDGKELIRTRTVRGSDEATPIDLALPEKTTVLTLIVDGTADGPSHDQADWCEPVAVGVSGKTYHLSDAGTPFPMLTELPFSFEYGGVHSSELLPYWTFETKDIDKLNRAYSWTDPKTGLKVTAYVRRFERFAGVDWVLHFENTSTQNTPLIENVKAICLGFTIGTEREPVVIHTLNGDTFNKDAWLPVEHPLRARQSKTFAPQGGRSSNGAFSFWNIQSKNDGDKAMSDGVFVALGWSGQWSADFARATNKELTVSAGMEKISTVLYPGEKIRSPRVLLMPWKNDRLSAHALFRRLLMFEYAPKMQNGMPQELSVAGQCFDRYFRKLQGWEKIDGQIAYAQKLKEAGCTAHWFDAAWFPLGFPNGVGNWSSDPVSFPNGVGELGKVIHDLDMKFILWFEAERVARGTEIAKEYPQYVFDGSRESGWGNSGLYKLNDPEARKYLTEHFLKLIKQFGVDVYRNDFNINPLPFWRANDEPNRQGMTEIRFVEGHYEMWNRFRQEVPGLWIDNCASGGRRIDLETISISVPLWRSDTNCSPGHPNWNQTQTLGLTQFIPLFGCCAWESDPYTVRSSATMGPIVQYNFHDDDYDLALARASILESHIHQKFWYGDFYPLSEAKTGETAITAYQLHRADLDAGVAYMFRQEQSPYLGRELQLRAIDPEAQYSVTIKRDYTAGEQRTMSGKALSDLEITLPEKRSAILIQYQRK